MTVDLSKTIEPKSDQINADDLIAGPRTITVARVVRNEDREQPISIFFEGDNGKPYKPGKSMRRVLVQLWGPDGSRYVGRSMTIYRDPTVKFAGVECGGIRISHMSHIEADARLALTTARGRRDPYLVKKLVVQERPKAALNQVTELLAAIDSAQSLGDLEVLVTQLSEVVASASGEDQKKLRNAYARRQKALQEGSATE